MASEDGRQSTTPRAVGLFVFDRQGTLLATHGAGKGPIGPERLGSLLALTGGLGPTAFAADADPGAGRMRFDGVEVVSVRGTRGVLAATYRVPPTDESVHELRRTLERLEKRWPSGSADGVAARAAKVLPRTTRPGRTPLRAAALVASVFGVALRAR